MRIQQQEANEEKQMSKRDERQGVTWRHAQELSANAGVLQILLQDLQQEAADGRHGELQEIDEAAARQHFLLDAHQPRVVRVQGQDLDAKQVAHGHEQRGGRGISHLIICTGAQEREGARKKGRGNEPFRRGKRRQQQQ